MKKIFKIFCFVLAICSINVNIVNAENNNSVMLWKVFQSKRENIITNIINGEGATVKGVYFNSLSKANEDERYWQDGRLLVKMNITKKQQDSILENVVKKIWYGERNNRDLNKEPITEEEMKEKNKNRMDEMEKYLYNCFGMSAKQEIYSRYRGGMTVTVKDSVDEEIIDGKLTVHGGDFETLEELVTTKVLDELLVAHAKYLPQFKEKIEELTKNQESLKQEKLELEKYKNEKTITKDGHQVELLANIGGPQDIQIVIDNTAEGVGLLRSEFLYMDAIDFPSEDEQFIAYKKIAESLENKRLVIRTLDIGGDKDLKYMKLPKEENPFLGYRAIRIYLDNVDLFKVQLRAILRASSYGNVSIMFPMISSVDELRKSKEIIEEVKKELNSKNIKFNENIEVGIMVEIPSSAIMADEFAKECDFFSIGTNDLIQYTIAVERGNEKLTNLYSHYNPAVIRLIKSAIDGAHKNGILCGMCGEAAGDVKFIPLLVGLGLDEFSMNANKILSVRKLITGLNFEECKKLANNVLHLASTEEVKDELENFS